MPAVTLAAVFTAFVYVHVRAGVQFARIDIGMTRADVVARLGPPRRIAPELLFCIPAIPWSGDCPDAGDGAEYLHYKFGIDRWVVIGVDSGGIVCFKTLGDT